MNAPLVVTKDPGLVETILGCAAVAGVTPVITRDIARVRALWTRAASVIVGTAGRPGDRITWSARIGHGYSG